MKKEDPKEVFNYFVRERWGILKRRERGLEKPWTKDEIFRAVYFCNIRREDDKTTKFIREWASPIRWYAQLPAVYTLARMLNWPDTLRDLEPSDIIKRPETILNELQNKRKWGHKVFSGAYLITTCGEKMDKLDYVMHTVDHVREYVEVKDTLVGQHKELMSVNGLGSFLAAQVVADLKNTENTVWDKAPDWETFAALGPGSVKGLNHYNGRNPDKSMGQIQFMEELHYARAKLYEDEAGRVPSICNQDLQNCFCEFSKYMRVLHGGRTKRNYQGY